MESTFERRMLEIASDILLAVSRGELAPDSAVVGAAAHAIARLRPAAPGAGALTGNAASASAGTSGGTAGRALPGAPADRATGPGATPHAAEVAAGRAVARAPRMVPPIEHVLAVAALMRRGHLPFAAACGRRAEESGVSAQAVRNACCRWLDFSAHDWQPLCAAGADEAALLVARRVVERQGWARQRVAESFGLDPEQLG